MQEGVEHKRSITREKGKVKGKGKNGKKEKKRGREKMGGEG